MSAVFFPPFTLALSFGSMRSCLRLQNSKPLFVRNFAEFKLRCPQGRKTKLYKRARLEKFAPYVMKDGLICRLSVYDDNQRQSAIL